MVGEYKIDRTPTGHFRIENVKTGQYGMYGPDGTHKTGHKFGWLTLWVVLRDHRQYSRTVVRIV